MNNIIFITWERHQRTRSFCNKLHITLEEVISEKKGIKRYVECIGRSFRIIKTSQPKTLIIQNPSIILACFTLLLKPFFGYKLIVDAHNEAIIPLNFNHAPIRFLAKLILRFSNLTLVTNEHLVTIVTQAGGRAFVLPDLLPELNFEPSNPKLSENEPLRATLICTYAADEPYLEVFKAAERLGARLQLQVTGKIPSHLSPANVPNNVHLTGFLSEENYWKTLDNSHLIIDLTTRENCLVCGAYEAIALQKPLLLSESPASLNLFGRYATHTENTSTKIFSAVDKLLSNYGVICTETCTEKENFITQQNKRINEITALLKLN